MSRPNLNENSEKLINKIKNNGVREYSSQAEIISKALELLWKEEKSLACVELNRKKVQFYEDHPEEIELNRKIVIGD